VGLRIALIACLALVFAPSAHAAPLTEVIPSTGFFQTDGAHYAWWGDADGTTLTILDTATGQQRIVDKPATCQPAPDFYVGRLSIGWVRMECGMIGDGTAFWFSVEVATGVTHDSRQADAYDGRRISAGPSCKRLAQAIGFTDAGWDPPYLVADRQVRVGRSHQEQLRLMHCGRRDVVLQHGRSRDALVAGGLVSWHTGLSADDATDINYRHSTNADALNVYSLRTGQRWSWPLPWGPDLSVIGFGDGRAHTGLSWHTSTAAFWAAALSRGCDRSVCETTSWRVYEAPLT
jgi:hypothetical protein